MPAFKNRNLISTDFHLPYNPQLVARARQMRKNPTVAEKKLWHEFLRTYKPRFLRQRPIDNYIVDFYCAQLKLVIEIDGDIHFTDEGLEYDEKRTRLLEGYGLKVMRFTNTEVLENFAAVCAAIEGIPPPPIDKGAFQIPPFVRGARGDSLVKVDSHDRRRSL
jgi:very-short-patch-repair endonuclease